MEGAQRSRIIIGAIVIVVIVVMVGAGYYLYILQSQNARQAAAQAGVESLYAGDLESSRSLFEKAMTSVSVGEERAGYQILLAATYEAAQPEKAADLYLDVVNTTTLTPSTRGIAATYLLMLLNARHDAAFTKSQFQKSPWADLYRDLQKDPNVNAEMAIAKAHEWVIALSPNFLSYFIAGEFYARKYPYLVGNIAKFKPEYASKAASYFPKGETLLYSAPTTGKWDKTRIALGYIYALDYAIALFESSLGSVDSAAVQALYTSATEYVDSKSSGETLMESARLSLELSYGRFVHQNQAAQSSVEMAALGDKIALLSTNPTNRAHLNSIMHTQDVTSKLGRNRPALEYLATKSPALDKVLRDLSALQ